MKDMVLLTFLEDAERSLTAALARHYSLGIADFHDLMVLRDRLSEIRKDLNGDK